MEGVPRDWVPLTFKSDDSMFSSHGIFMPQPQATGNDQRYAYDYCNNVLRSTSNTTKNTWSKERFGSE